MLAKITRILMIPLSPLALAACGFSGDEDMAKQVADARAAADQVAAERDAAALRAQAREAALAEFYAGEGGDGQDVPADDAVDSAPVAGNYEPPADDAPPANAESPQPRIAGA